MYTIISKSKPPVTEYYTGKHVSRVFEDLQKTKAANRGLDNRFREPLVWHVFTPILSQCNVDNSHMLFNMIYYKKSVTSVEFSWHKNLQNISH
jgi:hypothetical protein